MESAQRERDKVTNDFADPEKTHARGVRSSRLALLGLGIALVPLISTAALVVGLRAYDASRCMAILTLPFVALTLAVLSAFWILRFGKWDAMSAGARVAVRAGAACGILFLAGTAVLPTILRGNECAMGVGCRSNTRMIAVAMEIYAADYGAMPPTLQTLVDKRCVEDATVFRCEAAPSSAAFDPHDVDATGGYYYASPKSNLGAREDVPIVWERGRHYDHSGGLYVNAIFADYHVDRIGRSDYKARISGNAAFYMRPPVMPEEPSDSSWVARPGGGK